MTTPYLKLAQPAFDDMPWDEALNGNMSIIDAVMSNFMAIPNFVGAWQNSTAYIIGQNALDVENGVIYTCIASYTSSVAPLTFTADRIALPGHWEQSIGGYYTSAVYAPTDSPALTGTPTAPTPAVGDNDTSIATTAFVKRSVDTSLNDVGRNLLHNGFFRIQQRGVGPFTSLPVYNADRWLQGGGTDSVSITLATLADADRAAIGDEFANACLQNVFTGNAAAGAYNEIQQRMETVRLLAGKTVTLSFWAKAASGAPKLGINGSQYFGTGGSPSSAVNWQATGIAITLSTTWTRYTATFTLPSIAGKTLGSNGDDSNWIRIAFSSGATNNAYFGNIGVQSGTVQIWGVQLEFGSIATPVVKTTIREEWMNCQRFYQVGTVALYGYGTVGGQVGTYTAFPVLFRAAPTVSVPAPSLTNVSGFTVSQVGANGFIPNGSVTGTGMFSFNGSFTATAEL